MITNASFENNKEVTPNDYDILVSEIGSYFDRVIAALEADKEQKKLETEPIKQLQNQPNLQRASAQKSSLNIWKKGNQLLALASGGAFVGGLIAQVPGAIIGSIIAAVYGLITTPQTN